MPAKTCMAQPKYFDAYYARLEEIETSVKGFMSTQFEYNSYFRRELKEQNSFLACMSREVDDMAKEFLALNSQFARLEKLVGQISDKQATLVNKWMLNLKLVMGITKILKCLV